MKKILFSTLGLLLVFTSSCKKEEIEDPNQPALYMYEVSATDGHYITYITYQTPQEVKEVVDFGQEVGPPSWTFKWSQTGKRYLHLSSHTRSIVNGKLTVRIYRNGKVIAEKTATGFRAKVELDGLY